ncbi:uncharacterized protein RCH25_037999 [Pelodytes ibericus]
MVQKRVVGIFSRESEESYQWITDYLRSLPGVSDVRPVYISSTSSQIFRQEISKCDFAILYHTKNRGRVNITNVTDSLYDRELRDLSMHHGKTKVIVVIDDLEDNSWEQKTNILKSQPSIQDLATDLFLFRVEEKEQLQGGLRFWNADDPFVRKLREIEKLLTAGSVRPFIDPRQEMPIRWRKWIMWLLIAIIVFVVILIIALCVRPGNHGTMNKPNTEVYSTTTNINWNTTFHPRNTTFQLVSTNGTSWPNVTHTPPVSSSGKD